MKAVQKNFKTKIIAGILATVCMVSTATMCMGSVSAAEINNNSASVSSSNESPEVPSEIKGILKTALGESISKLNDVIPGFFLIKDYAVSAAQSLLGLSDDDSPDATAEKLAEISSKLDNIEYSLNQKFSKVLAGLYKLDNLKSAESAVNCLSTLNSQVTVRVKSEIDYLRLKLSKGQKITSEDREKVIKRIADINSDSISSSSYSYAIKNLFSYINGENIEACMSGTNNVFEAYFKYLKMNSTHGKIAEDARKFATLIVQHYSAATYYNILSNCAKLELAQKSGDTSAEIEAKANINSAKKDFDEVIKKYKAIYDKTEGIYVAVVTYEDGTVDNYYNIAAAFDEANRSGKNFTIKLNKSWYMQKVAEDKKESSAIPDLESLSFANKNVTIDLNGNDIRCLNDDAAISIRNGNLTIKNGTIRGGKIGVMTDNSNLELDKCVITEAPYGIYENSSNITLNSSRIQYCSTGVLLSRNSSIHNFKAENTTFQGTNGAIILNGGHHMNAKNCTFNYNRGNEGGAVKLSTNCRKNVINFDNCTFNNNTASDNGGAVYIGYYNSGTSGGNKVNFNNCKFEYNKTKKSGGAIYGQYVNINMCSFNSNKADEYSGAVYIKTHETVKNSSFNDNTAKKDGGAVYCPEDSDFHNCSFNRNHSDRDGDAIYVPGKTKVVLKGCEIKNNGAKEGGGLWLGRLLSSDHELYDCTITGNRASKQGGGIYTEITTFDGCADLDFGGKMTVTDNTANGKASNVYLNENWCKKCLIYANKGTPLLGASRIGISSATSDRWLDVVRVETRGMYNDLVNSFTSDGSRYTMKHYVGKGSYYWYYIDR